MVAFRVCKIFSNLSLIILVLSSSPSLLFSRFSSLLLSFLLTFSPILAGFDKSYLYHFWFYIISVSSSIRLSNDLSLQNLAALSLNVWALIGLSKYIASQASFILFINPQPRFLTRFLSRSFHVPLS